MRAQTNGGIRDAKGNAKKNQEPWLNTKAGKKKQIKKEISLSNSFLTALPRFLILLVRA